jgi:hypothetical protein
VVFTPQKTQKTEPNQAVSAAVLEAEGYANGYPAGRYGSNGMKILSSVARRVVVGSAALAVAGVAAGLGISSSALASSSSAASAATVTAKSASWVPQCTARDLGVWVAVDQGHGAAG